jgi:hypothetical protein
MLSVVVLNAVVPSDVVLNVVMLRVVTPFYNSVLGVLCPRA